MRDIHSNLTQAYVQHLLHYDPLTGEWIWMNPLPFERKAG
jgi:hypothetical protein